jgi:hypothetical protein
VQDWNSLGEASSDTTVCQSCLTEVRPTHFRAESSPTPNVVITTPNPPFTLEYPSAAYDALSSLAFPTHSISGSASM